MMELWRYGGLWQPTYPLWRVVPMEIFVQDANNIYKIQTISLKPNFHMIMAGFVPRSNSWSRDVILFTKLMFYKDLHKNLHFNLK